MTEQTTEQTAKRHGRGGRRRAQMVGDVACQDVKVSLQPHQVAWLRDRAAGRGTSLSEVLRLMIDAAMGGSMPGP